LPVDAAASASASAVAGVLMLPALHYNAAINIA